MARRPTETLTEREAQVMDAVWRLGEVTAEQVRAALPDQPHDSTVRTLLRILVDKGYLAQDRRGRAYTYRARRGREAVQRHAVRGLLARLFGGKAEDLVLRLIEDEHVTAEQIEALRRSTPTRGRRGREDES
jgi:BlaI family penicillinase repressor